ncbi:MAG: aminotransferase class III-fold pyridoxal phosphate-dependent enzyme [Kiritimatiellae bacterium]|nr:aminotransferase class III-fold pyridoxal phosphate-dependent enzyme [Kiritimatiellia bacterium]
MDKVLEKIYGMSDADCADCARHLMLGGGTRGGPMLVRGQGVRLYDRNGKDYIDCTSQSWAMYLGYAHPDINRVVAEQMERLSHVHQGFDTLPRFYLARELTRLAGGDLNRVSFTVGGGPALEAAMKIAYKNTQPSRDFICLYDSYHGTTLGTMGASWVSTRASGKLIGGSRYLGLTRPFVRVPNPYCYRCPLGLKRENCGLACARMLRLTLERGIAGNAAGFVMEPVQASGGQIIPPAEYFQEVRRICDDYKVPLIYDEIQTYGRIGRFFAHDHFGVRPDIIILGKGFGAGLPIAAVIVSDKLKGFEPDAEELHTFANTSVGQVAAAKLIDLLEGGVLENTRRVGAYLDQGLRRIQRDFPELGDIRQLGLHIGLELVKDPDSRTPAPEEAVRVRDAAMADGLILGMAGPRHQVLKIKPPLIVRQSECDEILDKFSRAMRAVWRK